MSQTFTSGLPGYVGKLDYLVSSLIKIERTRGTLACLTYIKQVRIAVLHYLSGEYPDKKVPGVGVTKDGIPKVLGPLIELVRDKSSPTHASVLRMILTLLFSTRALKLGTLPSTKSIEEPAKAVTDFSPCSSIFKYRKDFWYELGYTRSGSVPKAVFWKKYHFTSKSGPNGHALWTSMTDFTNLSRKDRMMLSILGGPKMHKVISLLECFEFLFKRWFSIRGTIKRKLSWFPDREDKTRVVAIGDYWSQTALRPLHFFLFRVLRKINQDCTFSQASFVDKIKDWTDFYSIDLTAATDRFPIQFISLVLRGRFPEEYVDSWEYTMVGKPFSFNKRLVSYSVGNPMGFYSSWNSFALAHHFVMYCCCKDLGIEWKTAKYCILGDDVLIGQHTLAMKYMQYIQALGVEFSPLKTHTSKTLCEFAKRYVYRGVEITPFPISALKESAKRFYLLVSLFSEQMERGWIPFKGIPGAVSSFYKIVKRRNSTFCAKLAERSYTCELIMKVMRGSLPACDAFNSIARKFEIPVVEFTDEDSKEFLNGFLYEAFVRSDPQYSDNKEPLGLLAEELVMKITGVEDERVDYGQLFEVPQHIPILNVYGQIEEDWLKLRKEADGLLTRPLSEWTIVTTMTIPLSDRVFVERQSHLVARASAILGDKLIPALKQLASSPWHQMLR